MLLPNGTTPLTEEMLTQIYAAVWRQQATRDKHLFVSFPLPFPPIWEKCILCGQSVSINLCRHWPVGDLWPSRITISPWAEIQHIYVYHMYDC